MRDWDERCDTKSEHDLVLCWYTEKLLKLIRLQFTVFRFVMFNSIRKKQTEAKQRSENAMNVLPLCHLDRLRVNGANLYWHYVVHRIL